VGCLVEGFTGGFVGCLVVVGLVGGLFVDAGGLDGGLTVGSSITKLKCHCLLLITLKIIITSILIFDIYRVEYFIIQGQ
jgi:membrane-bound ClpP family serine protease